MKSRYVYLINREERHIVADSSELVSVFVICVLSSYKKACDYLYQIYRDDLNNKNFLRQLYGLDTLRQCYNSSQGSIVQFDYTVLKFVVK